MTEILCVYLLYLAAALVPGPNLLVIAEASLGSSRAHGIVTALGVSTGTIAFSAASLAGLSTVLVTMPSLATAVRICGAVLLLCLGCAALVRAARGAPIQHTAAVARRSLRRAYVIGLLTHLSNPKALLFYLSLMTIAVTPETPISVRLLVAAGIAALSLAWYGSAALLLSRENPRRWYARAARWIDALLGTVLIGAGVRLAFDRGD